MTWVVGAVGAIGAMGSVAALAGCTTSSADSGDASPPDDANPATDAYDGGITVTTYPCPTIVALSAAPSEIDGDGGAAVVTVQTMVPDGGILVWDASSGSFADAAATNTTFSCAVPGTVTLTATVTYQLCKESEIVMVNCL